MSEETKARGAQQPEPDGKPAPEEQAPTTAQEPEAAAETSQKEEPADNKADNKADQSKSSGKEKKDWLQAVCFAVLTLKTFTLKEPNVHRGMTGLPR